jgi:hypothetical protein
MYIIYCMTCQGLLIAAVVIVVFITKVQCIVFWVVVRCFSAAAAQQTTAVAISPTKHEYGKLNL